MRKETKKIAVCGIMGALAVAIMLLGGILPLSTFLAPCIAGILIMPVAIEYGSKSGVLLYICIGILSLFIAADKEMALIFVFFLGHYPLLKTVLEKIKSKLFKFTVKLITFNSCVIIMYALVMLIFPMPIVTAELKSGTAFITGLLLMANATFIIYDFAVARLVAIYCTVWRNKLMKML